MQGMSRKLSITGTLSANLGLVTYEVVGENGARF